MPYRILCLTWILVGMLANKPTLAQPLVSNPKPDALVNLWRELLELDAEKAYSAMRQMALTPKETVAFLREALPPARAVEEDILNGLIRKLGSERFQEREQARKELEGYGWQALEAMRKAAQGNLDLESKRRLDRLLARLVGPLSGTPLQCHRAVEVVEWIGTDEARDLVERWSQGAAAARLTQEANKVLKRWGWRPEYRPGSRPWAPGVEPAGPARPLGTTHKASRLDPFGDPIPAGAMLRLGTTRLRAGAFGLTLLYTPDGKRMVVVGDHLLVMVDARDGKILHQRKYEGYISNALLTPDGGRLVATGYLGNFTRAPFLQTWDVKDFKKDVQWKVEGTIRGFGRRDDIALLETVHGVHQFDMAAGREISFHPLPGSVGAMAAVSGTTAVARSDNGKQLHVYDWSAPEEIKSVELPGRYPLSIALSPDGRTLACGGDKDYGILLYNVATSQLIRHLTPMGPVSTQQPQIRTLVFSPDGHTLAFTDDGSKPVVALWDMENHKLRWKAERRTGSLVFSPDSRFVAGGGALQFHMWDAATGKELTLAQNLAASPTRELVFAPDGKSLLVMQADAVRVCEFPSGKEIREFAHAGLSKACVSPDGMHLATSSLNHGLCLWDMTTGRELVKLSEAGRRSGYALDLVFTKDGKHLCSWVSNYRLQVWDVRNCRLVAEHLPRPKGFPKIDFADDNLGRRILQETELRSFRGFSADGSRLIWEYEKLHLFDTITGKEVQTLGEVSGRGSPLTSLDQEWLLVATRGGSGGMSVINLPRGIVFAQVEVGAAIGAGQFAISADGRCFAVAKTDRKIHVYETASVRQRFTILLETGSAGCLAFSPEGRYLAAVHSDGTVLAWDLRNPP